MFLRTLFIFLLLVNLVFLAWAQGYLGGLNEDREPQRVAQQINADKLRIVRSLPGEAAPAPKPPDPACRVVEGLKPAEADALRTVIAAAGGESAVLPVPPTRQFLVLIMDLAGKPAAEKKSAELLRLGVADQETVALADGRHEIVLGRFGNEALAREHLNALAKKGIKSARVDGREQPATRSRLEVRAPSGVLLPQLPQWIAPYAEATLADCPR